MAWWQKRLLRYALSRTGLLDDAALDPDNLDITLGTKNVVELKDVGLNIKRISKLAQLPPNLRVETARVLFLRLTVPADIYQSSIVAEVDGVELNLILEEKQTPNRHERKVRGNSPVTTRIPPHRKVHRRLHSPPPYDPGGSSDSEEDHLPTTEELAKSFLQEEPIRERKELEASLAANSKPLDESIVSESSEGDDLGTGAGIGLPSFLASFLQGIVDRLQVTIRNVEAKLETEISGNGPQSVPVTLRLHIGGGRVAPAGEDKGSSENQEGGRRQIKLQDLSLHLLSDAAIFSEFSEMPSRSSPAESRRDQSPVATKKSDSFSSQNLSTSSSQLAGDDGRSLPPEIPDEMLASVITADDDRFADAGDDTVPAVQGEHQDLEIHPGDDNVSWGTRRIKSNAPVEDLWNSMTSEHDLPESLLLERASTPRAHSPKAGSPNTTRNRRAASPYARSLQSPGSWPRLDESPQRLRTEPSPGSWPTLDQSQQGLFQPLALSSFKDSTDNKRAALEASVAGMEGFETPPEDNTMAGEDLAASRLFSHEEAESMYMSAMTQSPRIHIPGGWSTAGTSSDRSSSLEESENAKFAPSEDPMNERHVAEDDLAYGERPYSTPDNATPRARSPEASKLWRDDSKGNEPKTSRQLVYVDAISVWLPSAPEIPEEQEPGRPAGTVASSVKSPKSMPGTFSAYSEMSASRHGFETFAGEGKDGRGSVVGALEKPLSVFNDSSPIRIELTAVKCQLDMSCGRLLYRLISRALELLELPSKTGTGQNEVAASKIGLGTAVSVSTGDVWIALKASAHKALNTDTATQTAVDNLVSFHCLGVDFTSRSGETELRLGAFSVFVGETRLLSFDRDHDLSTSATTSDQTPDVTLVMASKKLSTKSPVSELVLETLPLHLLIDLQLVDDTFEPFGGLSGVLEVGNSILAESVHSSPSSPMQTLKAVRFEGDAQHTSTEAQLKVNGRIGGVRATLQGSTCCVQMRTTAIEAKYREQGAVATLEKLLITGPYLQERDNAPLSVDVSSLRLEYLMSPQDKDLERLLSLLTPSKDKYDSDDDILIDTLLRQRKKGAVLRVSSTNIKLHCLDWECANSLQTLGTELGRLSAVTKYLPEDERPGLLTLIRIKECGAVLQVNKRFGNVQIGASDAQCAHVGLPALLALSVGRLGASRDDKTELVHPLISLSGSENLPMVMARMLGDEVEPTVKVKLFNVCAEYSVPVLAALVGLDRAADTEEVIAELSKSVANFTVHQKAATARRMAHGSDSPTTSTKKTNIDILVHDSAIGLVPQKQSSKGLLVLTDTVFSIAVPPEDVQTAKLEIRRAGLFIADQILPDSAEAAITTRGAPNNTATKPN